MPDHTVHVHIPELEWLELPTGLDIVVTANVHGVPVTAKAIVDRRSVGKQGYHLFVDGAGIGTYDTLSEARDAGRRHLTNQIRARVAWDQMTEQLGIAD